MRALNILTNRITNALDHMSRYYFKSFVFFSSCDGYSDSQYEEMNGNGGEHYNFNRMAEDDYCKDINNSTNVAKFGPGQAWCLPKDYNQEKTPFTCKIVAILYDSNNIR